MDDSPRSATAESLEPTETLTLHRDDFIHYISDNPAFALHVLQTLAKHIRRLNAQLADIFFLDLPGRLARTLESGRTIRAGQRRRNADRPVTDADRSGRDEWGNAGKHRSKPVSFRRSGWITITGRKVTIIDQQAMEDSD
ncbi:MAG: Crp/Fnr family transcriptional regulator [Chloroflexota bacterium]